MSNIGLLPIQPGQLLREIIEELVISQAQFARATGMSPVRISHVIKGARPEKAELALLFGRTLGQSPKFWLNLQATCDLLTAERSTGKQLSAAVELVHA